MFPSGVAKPEWSRLQKTADSPQLQSIQVVDISFVAQRQFPMVQTSQLTTEVPQLPFVSRWSMPLLCRSCLPYLLLSTTSAQGSDSAEHHRGPAITVHQVRRQFPVVVQKLIPVVLVTMGIPQYSPWWSSLLATRANSSLLSVEDNRPQLRLVVFFRQCRRHPCRGADTYFRGALPQRYSNCSTLTR